MVEGGFSMSLNFDLPKDAELTRKVVREFAEKEIAPVAQELDDKEEFSSDLTRKMGELDFFGPFVSEEYGGSEAGYLNY
jgi:alkylation response protein AidB-like acyl-CoA dehydrogenase